MIRRKYISILMALAMVFAPAAALASTEGPNSGTVFATVPAGGQGWTNPGNAAALDSVYATSVLDVDVNPTSDFLKATGFGFTLAGCTMVSGITLEFTRAASIPSRHIRDNGVFLLKAGLTSDDKSLSTDWPGFSAYSTYGSSSDLWGRTWACSDVTAAGFGAEISASVNCTTPCGSTARIDHIRITVEYSTTSATDNPSGAHRRGATIFRSETRGG